MMKNSDSAPIRIDWVRPGLGGTLCPGKQQPHSMTGVSWARSLGQDLRRMHDELGVNVLVTLMTEPEMATYQVSAMAKECAAAGIEHIFFSLPDGTVPTEDREPAYRELMTRLHSERASGKVVCVHCLGGLGRTGTLLACVLLAAEGETLGWDGMAAIRAVRAARKGSVENARQVAFVERMAATLKAEAAGAAAVATSAMAAAAQP